MDVIVFESAQHIQVRLQGVFNDDLRIITMARVTVIVAVVIGQGNEEIIDLIAAGTTPEAVVAFHPSDSVQQRVAELVERSKEGTISAEDQSELDDYLQLEHIMIMAKARARQHTRRGK